MTVMRVSVIGTGYVGLVTGVCLAALGHEVVCTDKDAAKVARMKAGECPIFEPGLGPLMQVQTKAGRLTFSTDIPQADIYFIAVGTPPHPETGHADLSFVLQAAEDIAVKMPASAIVVTKSTVPVGTSTKVAAVIHKHHPSTPPHVASNPEFLREGKAVEDFMKPDRIIIGVNSATAQAALHKLYAPLTDKGAPLVVTTPETSELTKYAANAFLATKVAFINEIADLCEQTGANVEEVAHGMGLDPRIGPQFLKPGPGYGGSCFPKDTLALIHTGESFHSPLTIIRSVIASNDRRKERIVEKIIAACEGSLKGKTVAVLGVTFKAGTDDVRESPALTIIPLLHQSGAALRIYDPEGMENARSVFTFPFIAAESPHSAMHGADAAVILTEWDVFRDILTEETASSMNSPLLCDFRNLFTPEAAREAGFRYLSLGRPSVV